MDADLDASRPLTSLFWMAMRQRNLFLGILALAGFSSLLLLVQPLLYREAVNDVAGVFVKNSVDDTSIEQAETTLVEAWKSKVPHTRHTVAHRTPKQAMSTLIVVVVLLLLISLLASFTTAWAEIMTSRAGHGMERAVILAAFRKALHLPLSRDSTDRASFLTKQVDQVEQVEPVVTMLALRVGPEVISLVGILAIMLSQSRLLAVVALAPLPLYVWVAVASTKRLGVNLDSYYQLWQSISGRISGKPGGPEDREGQRGHEPRIGSPGEGNLPGLCQRRAERPAGGLVPLRAGFFRAGQQGHGAFGGRLEGLREAINPG